MLAMALWRPCDLWLHDCGRSLDVAGWGVDVQPARVSRGFQTDNTPMPSTERAARFLSEIGRADLAALLRYATYEYATEDVWYEVSVTVIQLSSPVIYAEAIEGLPDWDQKRIAESVHNTHEGDRPEGSSPDRLLLKRLVGDVENTLFADICIQRNQMVAVSTGRGRIQDFDDYYKARRRRITAGLAARGIDDTNPFDSLWDWYHKWKADLGSYSERRRYINDLFESVTSRVLAVPIVAVPEREPTGWLRVDRAATKARQRLESARHEEDYQTVGLLCREVLISVGQAVFDPSVHQAPDGVAPSATDAARMIEAFVVQAAAGGSNENVRRHTRASLQLAVELQHRRTADFRAAALCLEASSSVANIIAILSGQRDREDHGPA
jgi:hypothetical protein